MSQNRLRSSKYAPERPRTRKQAHQILLSDVPLYSGNLNKKELVQVFGNMAQNWLGGAATRNGLLDVRPKEHTLFGFSKRVGCSFYRLQRSPVFFMNMAPLRHIFYAAAYLNKMFKIGSFEILAAAW